MLETKPLAEMTSADLKEFLELRVPEGARIDYKQAWDDDVVKHVAALANTRGGHVLVGVAEDGRQGPGGVRLNLPKSGDPPGVTHGGKDLAARYRDQVVSKTQPRLAPEVRAIPLEDDPDKVVVIVRVPESLDAPHEVYLGKDPRIVVRRQDSSQPATLEEIERLIARRNEAREGRHGVLELTFFERPVVRGGPEAAERVANGASYPSLAALVRPRKALSAGFSPNHALDRKLRSIGLDLELFERVEITPVPAGVVLWEPEALGYPSTRLEVRAGGAVEYARALTEMGREEVGFVGGDEEHETRYLLFGEISSFLQRAVLFASRAHALSGRGVELEVIFGLDGCADRVVRIPARTEGPPPYGSYNERLGSNRVLASAAVDPDPAGASIPPGEFLRLIRECSRACGMSVPDSRLDEYVLDTEQRGG